jgi:hypothetical protein
VGNARDEDVGLDGLLAESNSNQYGGDGSSWYLVVLDEPLVMGLGAPM